MSGRTTGLIQRRRPCQRSTTRNHAARKADMVSRLQWQLHAYQLQGVSSLSCNRERRGDADRTCSAKRSFPPGRRTRATSERARWGFSTVQSTSVDTTVSTLSSSKGSSSAGATTTETSRGRQPPARFRSFAAIPRSGSVNDVVRVVAEVQSGTGAEFDHPSLRQADEVPANISKPSPLSEGERRVVHKWKDPAPRVPIKATRHLACSHMRVSAHGRARQPLGSPLCTRFLHG